MTEVIAVVIGAVIGFGLSLILTVAQRNSDRRSTLSNLLLDWNGCARTCIYTKSPSEVDTLFVELQSLSDRICVLGHDMVDCHRIKVLTSELLNALYDWRPFVVNDKKIEDALAAGKVTTDFYFEYWGGEKRTKAWNEISLSVQRSASQVNEIASCVMQRDWISTSFSPE
ncbi:MAG: hypothetical protein Phyf2KO_01350 [Phycisphaerales bacterium]